jgi:hypothetical protein
MNQAAAREKDRDVYLFWGLHFRRLSRASEDSQRNLRGEILESLSIWVGICTSETVAQQVRRYAAESVQFLLRVVGDDLAAEHVMERDRSIIDEASAAIRAHEDLLRGDSVDVIGRNGIVDLPGS